MPLESINSNKKITTSSGGGYQPLPIPPIEKKLVLKEETTQQRQVRQREARRKELTFNDEDEKRWAANRERVKSQRSRTTTPVVLSPLRDDKKKSKLSSLLRVKPSSSKLPTKVVAYCWINTNSEKGVDNPLPSSEQGHGLLNVIANAKITPKVKHIIYLDRRNEGNTCHPSNIDIPDNVKFVSVNELLTKKSMATPSASQKIKELYQEHLKHSSPAFTKNIVSFLALNAGDYFFDFGVSITPGGDLAKHLNGETNYKAGPVGNGSYIMGGHLKENLATNVEILYDMYTRPSGLNPIKAVEILENLDGSLTPAEVVASITGKAKAPGTISVEDFLVYSHKMEKLLAERGVTRECEYARHIDSIFGNTIGYMVNNSKTKFVDGKDFINTHKGSHIHKVT